MGTYIARISTDNTFAQQHLQQLGTFWDDLRSALPEECCAEILTRRFTFGLYRIQAENRQNCADILRQCWEKSFPDGNISDILISDDTQDDAAELTTVIYKNYYGADDYLRLITQLNTTVAALKKRDAVSVLLQQNYLFAVDGGCGFTTLLNSFGDYLHRMHIYPEDQYKDRIYYREYRCGEESKNGKGSADDIIDSVREETPKHCYNVLGFDISYYLDGRKYDDLREFIHRLNAYQDDNVYVFRIPFLEKKALDEISGILSDQMLLRVVQIPPLPDCAVMESVWNTVTSRNFDIEPEILTIACEKYQLEKMDGRSYGFKTAEKVANELMLYKAADTAKKEGSGQETNEENITPDDLSGFIGDAKQTLTGYEALEELIGMQDIAKKVREIVAQVKIAIANDKLDRPCIHMRFTGAPGTGKTTVARIIGQILREEGVLRKGGFFEYEGRDLVAEYEGQTAVKAATICRDAYGSVLFIDEAYALNEGKTNGADFGREALATLVSEMENHRDDMLVVMAGYKEDMDELMKVNQGLRSRMPFILDFPNYTKQQLFEIFMLMVRKHFEYDSELEAQAKEYFLSLSDSFLDSKEFANARFVRNLYERTWSKGALRCTLVGRTDIVLTKEDFVCASEEKEFKEKIEMKKSVGFNKKI